MKIEDVTLNWNKVVILRLRAIICMIDDSIFRGQRVTIRAARGRPLAEETQIISISFTRCRICVMQVRLERDCDAQRSR
jgi:hypothetical protein